jgi:DNA-binding NtrC family response regulator
MPHALLVDDDIPNLAALAELVEREGFSTTRATTLEDARSRLSEKLPDLVLVDLFLPDGRGIELLKDLEGKPAPDLVLITGNASVETAIEALRTGVADYLPKPVDIPRLKTILANVSRTRELKEEIDALREELRTLGHFGPMIGSSTAMQRVYDLIARVAPTDATVLLTGDSGTGKDLAAQTVHGLSKRRKSPFMPLNCGAISPSLIESELFGHERGSFTGASRMHKGYFERAVGGTLFLDEITEMPVELQVKLLRVLETGVLLRVGGVEPVPVDVRVIAATNRDPEEAVGLGKLREDLLYRLKVFPIRLPTLQERGEDVVLLAEHFLNQLNRDEISAKSFSPGAIERMRIHNWPGNVRELKNVVHRAFILADDEIGPECLPPEVGGERSPRGPDLRFRVGASIGEVEQRLILATLEHLRGDKKRAAEVLGISLKTLYNRLHAYRGA